MVCMHLSLDSLLAHKASQWLRLLSILRSGNVVDDSLGIVLPIVCGNSVFGP